MTVTLGVSGGYSVPNWTLVTSSAPTGVSTVTYSGLSGYSKYRILAPNLVPSGAARFDLRLNGDSGSNYSSFGIGQSSGAIAGFNNNLTTQFQFINTLATTAFNFQIDIENALLLTPKFISGTVAVGTVSSTFGGQYITTSVITSITLVTSANNFSTGTIYILGAN